MFGSGRQKLKRVFSSTNTLFTNYSLKLDDQPSATLDVAPFKLHKLETGPSVTATLTKEDALQYFADMTYIRKMENITALLYRERIIRGFCHLYLGQEACCVGMKAAMRPIDPVITAYRDHGWCYMMGLDVYKIIAELAGKITGAGRGKGGSMHMYAPKFYGGNGIVGAQVPLGAGIAFAAKYVQSGAVCITAYGDGAANQGQVFESYNMSKLWNLPVIYVCENNGYGMGTSTDRASASPNFYTRGDYIPGIWIDGMDILAVREATTYAIKHCTSGKGPIILETATYRYSGHSMSDPGLSYRSREEIQDVRETRDPINIFRKKILKVGLATEQELQRIESECKNEITDIVKKVRGDSEVKADELTADVYENCRESHIRGVLPWNKHKHIRVGVPFKK